MKDFSWIEIWVFMIAFTILVKIINDRYYENYGKSKKKRKIK